MIQKFKQYIKNESLDNTELTQHIEDIFLIRFADKLGLDELDNRKFAENLFNIIFVNSKAKEDQFTNVFTFQYDNPISLNNVYLSGHDFSINIKSFMITNPNFIYYKKTDSIMTIFMLTNKSKFQDFGFELIDSFIDKIKDLKKALLELDGINNIDFNIQPGLSNAPEEERASILAKIEIS